MRLFFVPQNFGLILRGWPEMCWVISEGCDSVEFANNDGDHDGLD
jgi:hypothetical protein